ncbi:MAG: hypothetical protein ACRC8Q_08815 [Aeromonas sp.]
MSSQFSAACEQDVRQARYVRIAVYPAVKNWMPLRVQLEVSDCPEQLGKTSSAHRAGYYLVRDIGIDDLMTEINSLRSPLQRPATLEVM